MKEWRAHGEGVDSDGRCFYSSKGRKYVFGRSFANVSTVTCRDIRNVILYDVGYVERIGILEGEQHMASTSKDI